MRTVVSIACVSVLALLAACSPPADGYYDAQGNYISYDRNKSRTAYHPPEYPDETRTSGIPADRQVIVPVVGTTPTYVYTQRGYYDYSGNYITGASGLAVPQSMFPPAGLCRIWLIDRALAAQPPIESCVGIQTRVPAGAYVIYGG